MTSVSYAVGASNTSQEYFSNISSVLGGAERQTQTAQGAVLSLQRSVDNAVPFAPACVGCSHVFRKRPQGVAQTLSATEQGEAERLCDGCPCVGAEEICGAPSPYPCRSEGERRLPSQPPSQPSTKELSGASLPHRKKVKRLTYEATPNSARVKSCASSLRKLIPRGGTAASMSCRAAGAVARASRRKKN